MDKGQRDLNPQKNQLETLDCGLTIELSASTSVMQITLKQKLRMQ